MKFLSQIFLITAASFTFSHVIPKEKRSPDLNDLIGDLIGGISDFGDSTIDKSKTEIEDFINGIINRNKTDANDLSINNIIVDPACNEAMEQYEDCVDDDEDGKKKDQKALCDIYNSEKCQNLIKNGIEAVPECKNVSGVIKQLADFSLKFGKVGFDAKCSKDENNEYCPSSDFLFKDDDNENTALNENEVKLYDEFISKTCQSKKCTEAFINSFNELNKVENEFSTLQNLSNRFIPTRVKRQFSGQVLNSGNILNKTLDYLKSPMCSSQVINPGNAKSDASASYKLGSALIITLSLLLYKLI